MEAKTLDLKDNNPIFITESIEDVLKSLYNQFRSIERQNNFLREENKRLKSEAYKDEELSKLKRQYDEMLKKYHLGFPISEEENEKIKEWVDKFEKTKNGAIGGRYYYEFTPTSIGVVGRIVDSITKESFTFQELG